MPSNVCLVVIRNHVKRPDMHQKSMENHTMFSSLQQTPSFPYETDKIHENGRSEILAAASRTALTSASKLAFECNYSILHSINRLLELKVSSIYFCQKS